MYNAEGKEGRRGEATPHPDKILVPSHVRHPMYASATAHLEHLQVPSGILVDEMLTLVFVGEVGIEP